MGVPAVSPPVMYLSKSRTARESPRHPATGKSDVNIPEDFPPHDADPAGPTIFVDPGLEQSIAVDLAHWHRT